MNEQERIVGLGARTDLVAVVPRTSATGLSGDETKVLACVGRLASIDDVIARSGLSEPRTIAVLLALRAKGLIAPARQGVRTSAHEVTAALAEEVELPPERKKEILDLEAMVGRTNHFELFGLPAGAGPDEVKKAFYEASRRYHPDRYYGKNLGSFRGRLERVFAHMVEAHATLTDPERRAKYLEANPGLVPSVQVATASAVDPAREAERRQRMARHPYLAKAARANELLARAKQLLAKGDYGRAYTDLHTAAQIDERSEEIRRLLQEAKRGAEAQRAKTELKQAKDAQARGELEVALSSYRVVCGLDPSNAEAHHLAAKVLATLGRGGEAHSPAQKAVELDPTNAGYHYFLASMLAEAGMKALAKKHYEETLRLEPGHAEAKKHLKKWWPF